MTDRRQRSIWVVVALSALLAGCGRSHDKQPLVIFAASSLRGAFKAMSQDFERSHPDIEVQFNFAGTQQLRAQLENGANPDIFASADPRHMDTLVATKIVADPSTFARNEPVVVVSTEARGRIARLEDLSSAETIVLGTADVPIGRYSLDILDKARGPYGDDFRAKVEARVISRELNVRQVLAKVSLGEAEAAIVYRTDALAAVDRVALVSIPPELNVTAVYPIAVPVHAAHPELGRAWVAFVLSAEGQAHLRAAGFSAPSDEVAPQ